MGGKRRQLATTCIVVVSVVASVLGIIVDAPQAISRVAEYVPRWAANPDLLWVVAIVAVGALAIYLVWRQPPEPAYVQMFSDILSDAGLSLRGKRIAAFLCEIEGFEELLSRVDSKRLNHRYVYEVLTLVYPRRIEYLIGKQESDRFVSIVKETARKTQSSPVVCKACLPALKERLFDEMLKEGGGPQPAEKASE